MNYVEDYVNKINEYLAIPEEQKINISNVNEYIIYARDNPDCVDEEIKLLIINICIPILKDKNNNIFDEDTYNRFIVFAEKWFYKLFPYQKFISAFVFMYDLYDVPIFRTFFIIMGRGNGKDGFICPLLLFLSSEYYGIKNYNIDIVANDKEQTKETYAVILQMLAENKKIMKLHFKWNNETCTNIKTNSEISYNTSNPDTKDGKKSGALLFNEFHAYKTTEQIGVYLSGIGKNKHPRVFIISSFGYVRGGPFDEYLSISNLVLRGEANKIKIFPAIFKLKNAQQADDPKNWILANPSMEFMPHLKADLLQKYEDQKLLTSHRNEFLTKNMNLIAKQSNEDEVTSWDNILKASYKNVEKKIPREVPKFVSRKACIVGIDYASLNDFASVGYLVLEDDEYIWRQKTFICKNSPYYEAIKFPFDSAGSQGFCDFEVVDTPTISEQLIMDVVDEIMVDYDVLKIILDNYKFQLMKKAFIEMGLTIEDKHNPEGVVRMIRYPASIAAIYGLQIEKEFANGNINIGDSAIMRWFINNTSVKRGKDGNMSYSKIEPKLRKNDGFMAMVCAFSGSSLLEETVYYI